MRRRSRWTLQMTTWRLMMISPLMMISWLMMTSPTMMTLQQIKMMGDIGASDAVRGNFVSAFGVCMVLGGKLAGTSIKMFGKRGHTTLNNILTICAFLVFGRAKQMMGMWPGLILLLPTMERRAATSAMATDHAVATGMGRGEYQAAFANFRALTVVMAPLL